jgi:hypothetical protein
MPNPDWYPNALATLGPWHTTFSAQATATGTTHGLTAGNVTQAGEDSAVVSALLDYDDALRGYTEAWTAWRDFVLFGDPDDAPIEVPTEPALTLPGEGAPTPGIRTRTRGYANVIKASPGYELSVGEDYGIVAAVAPPPGVPAISLATALIDSDVALKLSKAGYEALAVDMRRDGGAFTQIGVSLTSTFVDETAPLVVGQPEVREYRVQGLDGNDRVGGVSATVSVSTTP